MKLTIQYGKDNPILRQSAKPVRPHELPQVKKVAQEMVRFIKDKRNGGIGLAAPQIGVSQRFCVVGLPIHAQDEHYQIHVLINPKITQYSHETSLAQEGCLSLPEVTGWVRRPEGIHLEYQDLSGKNIKKSIQGWGARVVQHELDHLDGVLIVDKFSPAPTSSDWATSE